MLVGGYELPIDSRIASLVSEVAAGARALEELADDVFFIAASPAMRKIRSQAALVANVDIPVLLLGESGTGKEVLARLIHKLSPRAHRTFLKVNCAAVPAIPGRWGTW